MKNSYTYYVPERFKGRTGYQIFVDRFCNEGSTLIPMDERLLKEWNDEMPNWQPDEDGIYRNLYFYGGNLQGIISKLGYIKNMGFDLIYLSPISFTYSSHHYDVEDQRIIDPWIGNLEDFKELCSKAHEKGILICVDLVFNHMGAQSKFFQEALRDNFSKYREWFEWDEYKNPIFWYGFKNMPQCNKYNSDYQDYAYRACEFYINMGADGVRLDLGENLPRDFMQKLRERVKKINPEVLIVSEMWDFATHKENPQIYGDQVDSVMNYPLADGIIRWIRYGNEKHFEYTYKELAKYPNQVQHVLWNFLDSHDTPRAINMIAGKGMNENPFSGRIWDIEGPWRKENAPFDTFSFRKWEADNDRCFEKEIAQKQLMLSSLLQYFMPGIPIVYYGTEAGVTGYKDPFNRKPYPWGSEDSVLLEHYRNLGNFRKKNYDVLANGETIEMIVTSTTLLMVRKTETSSLILVMNRTSTNQENPIKYWNMNEWNEECKVQEGTKEILGPYSAIVYRREN